MCRGQIDAALRENQKGRLKGFFGIVMMTRDTSAYAENHWTMNAHQALERVLITSFDELRREAANRSGALRQAPNDARDSAV